MNHVQAQTITVQQAGLPLYEARGWLRFLGIMNLIQGALAFFSVVGIIVCWIPIWIGLLLMQSVNQLEGAVATGDSSRLIEAQRKIKTYFIINGVITLIGVAFAALALVAVVIGIFGAIEHSPQIERLLH